MHQQAKMLWLSFNPCFDGNGLLARHPIKDFSGMDESFNPCFDGNGLLADFANIENILGVRFQSLF